MEIICQVLEGGIEEYSCPGRAIKFVFWYDKPRDLIVVDFGDKTFHVKHLYVITPCRSVWDPGRKGHKGPRVAITGTAYTAKLALAENDQNVMELR